MTFRFIPCWKGHFVVFRWQWQCRKKKWEIDIEEQKNEDSLIRIREHWKKIIVRIEKQAKSRYAFCFFNCRLSVKILENMKVGKYYKKLNSSFGPVSYFFLKFYDLTMTFLLILTVNQAIWGEICKVCYNQDNECKTYCFGCKVQVPLYFRMIFYI